MIYDYADYDNYDNSLHYSWIGIIRRIYEYPYYISTNSYEDDDNDNNYSVGDGSNDQISDVIKNVNSSEINDNEDDYFGRKTNLDPKMKDKKKSEKI